MAWRANAAYTLVPQPRGGFCANCPESPETSSATLRELGPTTRAGRRRASGRNMLTAVQVKAADGRPSSDGSFERFRAVAERAEFLRADA